MRINPPVLKVKAYSIRSLEKGVLSPFTTAKAHQPLQEKAGVIDGG